MESLKEITFDRAYDASLEAVWDAWTKPELIKQWWGPDNVTIPECEIDLRVGGRISIVMEAGPAMGPNAGMKWPMAGTFTVVDDRAKLAYAVTAWFEGREDTSKIEQSQELSLAIEDGKTRLYLKAVIHSAGPDAGMAIEGMQYGYNQQLDKLTTFLAQT